MDRRCALGRRDYAMLLLLVTYGLRGNEVAKLTLEDIDWQHEGLNIPLRKAGHWSAYSRRVNLARYSFFNAFNYDPPYHRIFFGRLERLRSKRIGNARVSPKT